MQYENDNTLKLPHSLTLDDRKALSISGVSDVDSFDEETVILYTSLGELTIKGEDLHVEHLSIDIGELSVTGKIDSLMYTDNQKKSTGFFGKVFK